MDLIFDSLELFDFAMKLVNSYKLAIDLLNAKVSIPFETFSIVWFRIFSIFSSSELLDFRSSEFLL